MGHPAAIAMLAKKTISGNARKIQNPLLGVCFDTWEYLLTENEYSWKVGRFGE